MEHGYHVSGCGIDTLINLDKDTVVVDGLTFHEFMVFSPNYKENTALCEIAVKFAIRAKHGKHAVFIVDHKVRTDTTKCYSHYGILTLTDPLLQQGRILESGYIDVRVV